MRGTGMQAPTRGKSQALAVSPSNISRGMMLVTGKNTPREGWNQVKLCHMFMASGSFRGISDTPKAWKVIKLYKLLLDQ